MTHPALARIVTGRGSTGQRNGFVLAALSFIIYGCSLFALPQVRDNPFLIERDSIAAAVSNAIYGTRIGALDSAVRDVFSRGPAALAEQFHSKALAEQTQSGVFHFDEPLQKVFDEARWRAAPPGKLLKTVEDDGIGYVLVATAALRIFGLHAWSLPLFMLGLMGLSAAPFLWRFSADLAGVVTLYFCTLTVMLFTPLVWDPTSSVQMAIGGFRYFSLVAILPAFHLALDVLQEPDPDLKAARRNLFLFGIQVGIFALAVLVRSNAASLIGAIAVLWLLILWRTWYNAARLRQMMRQATVVALVGISLLAGVMLSVTPEYVRQGKLFTTFWHRAVISLTVNPAWPFGFENLRESYDCSKYIPEGLQSGFDSADRNGHCIWWSYVQKHDIPADEANEELYGSRYETVMRDAFLDIARRYPTEVLWTFVYKFVLILMVIISSIQFNMGGYPPIAVGLLAMALANLLACFTFPVCARIANIGRVARVALLFAAFSIAPFMVAWAAPHNAADLLFYCLYCIGLALGSVLTVLTRRLRSAAIQATAEVGSASPIRCRKIAAD